jgi:hypothetical protein
MAIKPTDCIVYIENLIQYRELDVDGDTICIASGYVSWWQRFLENAVYDQSSDIMYSDEIRINRLLRTHNASYHVPSKNYSRRYIKFRSDSDYTMFVLKWS